MPEIICLNIIYLPEFPNVNENHRLLHGYVVHRDNIIYNTRKVDIHVQKRQDTTRQEKKPRRFGVEARGRILVADYKQINNLLFQTFEAGNKKNMGGIIYGPLYDLPMCHAQIN